MTSVTDVCNRMLQKIGTRTTVTDAEIAGNTSNEAIQFNLMYTEVRDTLLRKAPWNCAMKTANLTYLTSQPGTPENTSPATTLWQPGQPAPPWAYEYQYPSDCLEARWIIPATQTGFADGVPITTAVTGGASSWWWGQPVRFKIQTDQFWTVGAVTLLTPGTGYAAGDIIFLAGSAGPNGTPFGAGAAILVNTTGAGGAVATFTLLSQVNGANPPQGGSYFYLNSIGSAQGSTTGSGTGASFTPSGIVQDTQRVLLTNQESATLSYTAQVTDPNLFDPTFREALYQIGGAQMVMGLVGNREHANALVQQANESIKSARQDDGNEGLTINDVTPDWIRIRGVAYTDGLSNSGPYQGYDWGSYFPLF